MRTTILTLFFAALLPLNGCGHSSDSPSTKSRYGVFLSLEGEQAVKLKGYDIVVVDAQFLTPNQIAQLHQQNGRVFSYLNMGSLENWRDYHSDYQELALGVYENWEDEVWIDVSQERWQSLVLSLADEYIEKGIDGFFVDNCDVYYNFPKDEIYRGLETMLKSLRAKERDVVINGGDVFVSKYLDSGEPLKLVLTGVNQESVFSNINFENETFGTQDEENHAYYLQYLERVEQSGGQIYLLEYSTDDQLIEEIESYCSEHDWYCYISDSLELD